MTAPAAINDVAAARLEAGLKTLAGVMRELQTEGRRDDAEKLIPLFDRLERELDARRAREDRLADIARRFG